MEKTLLLQNKMTTTVEEYCTKYHQCMNGVNAQPEQDNFQIPSLILAQQLPIQISVEPVLEQHHGYLADRIAASNIKKVKNTQHQQQLAKLAKQKQIKDRLQALQKTVKNKIQHCQKDPLSNEKRMKWNHGIYNDKEEQEKVKEEKHKHSHTERRSEQIMKNVEERITDYKESERKKIEEKRKKQECQHHHEPRSNSIQETKALIKKSAQNIMKKQKQEKEVDKKKKQQLAQKIEKIQKQSLLSLSKFKKKPVDPSIDFILEGKKQKKITEASQKKTKASPKQLVTKPGFVKSSRKSSESQKIEKSKKKKKYGSGDQLQKTEIIKQGNPEFAQEPGIVNQKFYFWDIPISSQDVERVNKNEQLLYSKPTPVRVKGFGEEVREYLIQKNRQKMLDQNAEAKKSKFQQMVQEKKIMFLDQFEKQSSPKQQIFWSEDVLLKQEPIINFNI